MMLKVFVLEDIATDQELLKKGILRAYPEATISFFSRGEEILRKVKELAENDVPDLVLLDINVPDINGLDVLESLRRNLSFEKVPIGVLVFSQDDPNVEIATKKGASFCIAKQPSKIFAKVLVEKLS